MFFILSSGLFKNTKGILDYVYKSTYIHTYVHADLLQMFVHL